MKAGTGILRAALVACAVAAALPAGARQDGAADRPRRAWWPFARLAQVGLIEIEGPIYDARVVNNEVRKFDRNPLIKALVLRIDSPGGEVGAVQEIAAELKRFRDHGKPIVASFGGVAASGGYYLACGADKIISNPGALTGSIGVIMEFPDAESLLRKIGVRFEVIKSGRYKDSGSFSRGLTVEERAVLQRTIDDVYDQFLESVWEGRRPQLRVALSRRRGLPPAKIADKDAKAFLRNYADGRVMSGRQARDAGLVDALGGLEDAIGEAGRLAGLPGRPGVVTPRRRREASWTDLLSSLFRGAPPAALLPAKSGVRLGYILR